MNDEECRGYGFKHPEADTMLLSAYANLRADNYTEAVILDRVDTDVYVQAAYVSHQLCGDPLIKHNGDLINSRAMLSEEVAKCHHSIPCDYWC